MHVASASRLQGGAAIPPAATPPADIEDSGASLVYAEVDEVDKSNDNGVYAEPVAAIYAEPVAAAPGGGLARKGSFC